MTGRRGFSLIELITVVIVLGILASIALLKYTDLRNNALSAQMAQELRAIQVAAYNYYAEKESWPPETGPGDVPAGLGPLLPGQLASSFDRGDYLLDYENFGAQGTDVIIGVSVTTSDPKLFAKFVQYLGNQSPFFVSGGTLPCDNIESSVCCNPNMKRSLSRGRVNPVDCCGRRIRLIPAGSDGKFPVSGNTLLNQPSPPKRLVPASAVLLEN